MRFMLGYRCRPHQPLPPPGNAVRRFIIAVVRDSWVALGIVRLHKGSAGRRSVRRLDDHGVHPLLMHQTEVLGVGLGLTNPGHLAAVGYRSFNDPVNCAQVAVSAADR